MKIRAATMSDWDSLATFAEAMNIERVQLGEPDYTQLHLATLRAALLRELGGVYVADDENGNLVGFTAVLRFPEMPPGMAEGVGTYVLPEVRRTKVAHELGVAAYRFQRDTYGATVLRGSVYFCNGPSFARCIAEGAKIVGVLLEYQIPDEKG